MYEGGASCGVREFQNIGEASLNRDFRFSPAPAGVNYNASDERAKNVGCARSFILVFPQHALKLKDTRLIKLGQVWVDVGYAGEVAELQLLALQVRSFKLQFVELSAQRSQRPPIGDSIDYSRNSSRYGFEFPRQCDSLVLLLRAKPTKCRAVFVCKFGKCLGTKKVGL